MAIDFTKPIENFQTEEIVNVLYRDKNGIYFEYKNSDFVRMHCSIDEFNKMFQNVPEEPKKIKGYLAFDIYGNNYWSTGTLNDIKRLLIKDGFKPFAIVEINATEGEGLQ
jgi:hypothetical protein